MTLRFRNRSEAGELLAKKLLKYAGGDDIIVLALPRGGVPVGHVVAQYLQAPLDVLVVRKLGVPGHEELAMGAIASGGVQVLNGDLIQSLGLGEKVIARVAAREQLELIRRERAYRGGRAPPRVRGMTVILVDDGIATGATIRAAITALRLRQAGRIVVAAPTIAREAYGRLRREADELAAVIVPADFNGVGEWYDDFPQTTDEEVRTLLESAPVPDTPSPNR